jgi:hypothetical protein
MMMMSDFLSALSGLMQVVICYLSSADLRIMA